MIEITKLSDSDLEKIYQMACQRLKDEKASGKDVSGIKQKLTIISAEMIRRRKKEINDPERMNTEINDPEKNPVKIIDSEKMNPEINDPEKNPVKIIDPERINPEIREKKHSSNGDEER